ncbi:MAG: hypothetical protein KC535_02390 [Nanoarchaeota archaeon]|nr:hypothetical protein [Nanoarchaeota archaeon]
MKKYMTLLALTGGLALGEYLQPLQSMKDTFEYRNVPIAQGFPQDPWNYTVRRELLEADGKIYQGIYLVNEQEGIHKKIDEDGCTCSLSTSIDEVIGDAKDWFWEKIRDGKEWVQETYKNLTED